MIFQVNCTFPKFSLTPNTDIHWLTRVGKGVSSLVMQWTTLPLSPPTSQQWGAMKSSLVWFCVCTDTSAASAVATEEKDNKEFSWECSDHIPWTRGSPWASSELHSPGRKTVPVNTGRDFWGLADVGDEGRDVSSVTVEDILSWPLGRTEWYQVRPGDEKPGIRSSLHLNCHPYMGNPGQKSLCFSALVKADMATLFFLLALSSE